MQFPHNRRRIDFQSRGSLADRAALLNSMVDNGTFDAIHGLFQGIDLIICVRRTVQRQALGNSILELLRKIFQSKVAESMIAAVIGRKILRFRVL